MTASIGHRTQTVGHGQWLITVLAVVCLRSYDIHVHCFWARRHLWCSWQLASSAPASCQLPESHRNLAYIGVQTRGLVCPQRPA